MSRHHIQLFPLVTAPQPQSSTKPPSPATSPSKQPSRSRFFHSNDKPAPTATVSTANSNTNGSNSSPTNRIRGAFSVPTQGEVYAAVVMATSTATSVNELSQSGVETEHSMTIVTAEDDGLLHIYEVFFYCMPLY